MTITSCAKVMFHVAMVMFGECCYGDGGGCGYNYLLCSFVGVWMKDAVIHLTSLSSWRERERERERETIKKIKKLESLSHLSKSSLREVRVYGTCQSAPDFFLEPAFWAGTQVASAMTLLVAMLTKIFR